MHFSSSAMNGLRLRAPLCIGRSPLPRFCRVGRLLVCNSKSEEPGAVLKPSKPRAPVLPLSGYRSAPATAEIDTLDVTETSEDIKGVSGGAATGSGNGAANGTANGAVHENGNGADSEPPQQVELEVVEYDFATLTRTPETPAAAQASAPQTVGGGQRDTQTDTSPREVSIDNGVDSSAGAGDDGGRTLSLIEDLGDGSDGSFAEDVEEGGNASSLVKELNQMFDNTTLHKGDGLPFKKPVPASQKSEDTAPEPPALAEGSSDDDGNPSALVKELNDMFDKTALHKGDDLPFKGKWEPVRDLDAGEAEPPAPAKGSGNARSPAVGQVDKPAASKSPTSPPATPIQPAPKPTGRPQNLTSRPQAPVAQAAVQPKPGLASAPPPLTPPKVSQDSSKLVGPPSLAASPKPTQPLASLGKPPVKARTLKNISAASESPIPSPTVSPSKPAPPVGSISPPLAKAPAPAKTAGQSQSPVAGGELPVLQTKQPEVNIPDGSTGQVESSPPKLSMAPPPKPRAPSAAPTGRLSAKFRPPNPAVAAGDAGPLSKEEPRVGPKPGPPKAPAVQPGKLAPPPTLEQKPTEAVSPASPNLSQGPEVRQPMSIPMALERLRKKRVTKEKKSQPLNDEIQGGKPARASKLREHTPHPGKGNQRASPAGAGRQKRKQAKEGQFGGTSAENRRKARQQRQERRQARAVTQEREEIIEVGPEGMLVSELAAKLLETPADIIKTLFMKGIMVTMTQTLDMDTVKVIGLEYGVDVWEKGQVEIGDMAKKDVEFIDEDDIENLVLRPPVVTVMGHVDHGKTSLLDYIRSSSVAAGEAGGITQAIGAYQCEIDVDDEEKTICFLDTPGHEAFSAMRARGAKVTDVAVIIVAADDGLQPQTREAVSHAKAADVPIIIAINKIDIQGANPERIKQQLGELELIPEEWGGKTPVIPISAKTGEGIDSLLEVIVLMAEVELELMANPDRAARGTIVEADLDKRAGPVATMLVQNGTLKVGDIVVSGASFGKVRSLTSDRGDVSSEASPSTAVRMLGLDSVPVAGDEFQVCETETEAREIAEKAAERIRQAHLAEVSGGGSMVTLSSLASMDDEVEGIQRLNIVLRADTSGAVEAVKGALAQLPQDSVMIRYLHSAAGDITESDITLASPAEGVIMGFNVEPSEAIMTSAKQKGVEIRSYKVIYHLIDDIRAAMEGRIKSVDEKVPIGSAEVRAVFGTGSRTVAGCMVTDGRLEKGAVIEVKRKKKKVVYEGELTSLRRVKDIVNTVEMGLECGVGCDFVDWQEGDVIEAYTLVQKSLSLEEAHAPTAVTLEELELELAESNKEE